MAPKLGLQEQAVEGKRNHDGKYRKGKRHSILLFRGLLVTQ